MDIEYMKMVLFMHGNDSHGLKIVHWSFIDVEWVIVALRANNVVPCQLNTKGNGNLVDYLWSSYFIPKMSRHHVVMSRRPLFEITMSTLLCFENFTNWSLSWEGWLLSSKSWHQALEVATPLLDSLRQVFWSG